MGAFRAYALAVFPLFRSLPLDSQSRFCACLRTGLQLRLLCGRRAAFAADIDAVAALYLRCEHPAILAAMLTNKMIVEWYIRRCRIGGVCYCHNNRSLRDRRIEVSLFCKSN